ncbi:MAG TPA: kelch repeat-containing protein [Acidimicrobiales bacterium]|nr:kelch repeat-containing protein [Acidimicrobiales bacterium]
MVLVGCAAACSSAKTAPPAPMPDARTEIAGTAWHGDIVVVGGMTASGTASRRADLYNAFNNTWSPVAPLPIAVHHAGVALLDRLYVVGGYTMENGHWAASARVFSLGHGDAAWTEEPPLPEPRGALAVAAVGGRLIVAGGVVGGQPTASTAVFSPGTGWRAGPTLARAREHLAATAAGGRAYVIAGRVGGDNFTDVESWDGVDPTGWRREPSLNDSRGGIAAATVDNRPCVAGGEESTGTIASIECLERGRWRRVARMARARHGLVAATVGAQLHVIGGGTKPGLTVSDAHEVFALDD